MKLENAVRTPGAQTQDVSGLYTVFTGQTNLIVAVSTGKHVTGRGEGSLLFGLRQSAIVCRATIEFIAKVTQYGGISFDKVNTALGIRYAYHVAPSIRKSWH
jgi:hypothetical protein